MKSDTIFMYDDFSDRLFVSCKKPLDKVIGSVRILNLTLDLAFDNRVVNVELRKASEYLTSFGIDSSILNHLTGAKIIFSASNH